MFIDSMFIDVVSNPDVRPPLNLLWGANLRASLYNILNGILTSTYLQKGIKSATPSEQCIGWDMMGYQFPLIFRRDQTPTSSEQYIYIYWISTFIFASDQICHPIEWDGPYYTFTNMFKQPFHTGRRANIECVYFELDPCSSNMIWVCTSGMEHFSWYCWSIEHTPSGVLCNITLW